MRVLNALLFCATVVGCSSGKPEEAVPGNLVVICVDTLRADYLGTYGAEPSNSPNLDAFADGAVVFENAHSHASWTLPSFASVLTSLYSSTHGCWDFQSRLSEDFETLVEIFQAAGFDTHGIASHVYFNETYGLQQGFDTFDDELAKKRTEGGWTPISSPVVTDKAIDWLGERGREKPFLLWVHYFDPHFPYLAHGASSARAAEEMSEEDRYRSEIRFTDGHVGRLLRALDAVGHGEDTVVVFLSDHGEAFGEHEGVRRHSYSLYGEEVRVPLMLRVPGMAPRRVREFVRNVDIGPTLLELFGLEAANRITAGVELLGAMKGEGHAGPALLCEIRLKDGHHANALINGKWKLIENVSRGVFELYDLEEDPLERLDRAAEEPAVLERLKDEMKQRIGVAEMMSERFSAGGVVELSDEELRRLLELGYGK